MKKIKRELMTEKIAVETLTLSEISDFFKKAFEIALPKSKGAIAKELKRLKKLGRSKHKWIKTYEDFKGAKLNFYCQKVLTVESPIVAIGMSYRTKKGLILISIDTSNGGIPPDGFTTPKWNGWVRIYTGHFCVRYAERIMKADTTTFQIGSEGIMFSDTFGLARITDTIADGIDEIELQFKGGQAYGYRDSKSKITYFKTVYSNDMLKGDRLAFKKEWEQPLDELYELFKWR